MTSTSFTLLLGGSLTVTDRLRALTHGSRVIAACLRDAGMEVIYTPPWQEISTVVKLTTEEDADEDGQQHQQQPSQACAV